MDEILVIQVCEISHSERTIEYKIYCWLKKDLILYRDFFFSLYWFIQIWKKNKINTLKLQAVTSGTPNSSDFWSLYFPFKAYPALSSWVPSRKWELISITYMKLRLKALATPPDLNQQNIIPPTNQYMEIHPRKWYHPDTTKHAQTEQWHSWTGRSS